MPARRRLPAAVPTVWAVLLVLAPPAGAVTDAWRWPVAGEVARRFEVTPRTPYAAGQRRGIDIASRPGAIVRAACGGRVTFAGAVPGHGLGVSVRCGTLTATHLRLRTMAVRPGRWLVPGAVLGRLGPTGRLRLGARVSARRHGYLDPLTLLRSDATSPPVLAPAPLGRSPRARAPHPPPLAAPARAPSAPAAQPIPLPAWAGMVLMAAAIGLGPMVARRRRRAAALELAREGP